jgi:hypothetical protein
LPLSAGCDASAAIDAPATTMLTVCAMVTIPGRGYGYDEATGGIGHVFVHQASAYDASSSLAKVQVHFPIASRGSECSALEQHAEQMLIRFIDSQLTYPLGKLSDLDCTWSAVCIHFAQRM